MPGPGLAVVATLLLLDRAAAHVSLQFPPARDKDLDFLDSFRTEGDCGMKKGTVMTTLVAGEKLNVTWHLGYPHQGGYLLELRDGAGEVVQGGELLRNNWNSKEKNSDQSAEVDLPSQPCDNCYLKFTRQALEWGNSYQFRSCADIKLVSRPNSADTCSGRGSSSSGGGCTCNNHLHTGDRCQYETECVDDNDCNGPKGQGKCKQVDNSVFPRSQCFCAPGWQGRQCDQQSTVDKSFDRSAYTEVSLKTDMTLLWREVSGSEVEMIVEAPTTSWVGLGWRPAGIDKSCWDSPAGLGRYRDASGSLHGMDCTDVVIGTARGGLGRVADYYTRDRSTPREDREYFDNGGNDLVGSFAWEEDGKTTVRFIKKTQAGPGDHPLSGELHLIWAHGQLDEFYKADQLKFHGTSNRGVTAIMIGEPIDLITVAIVLTVLLTFLLLGLQAYQNYDKKMSLICPNAYKRQDN